MLLKGPRRPQFLSPVCAAWKSGSRQQCAFNSSFTEFRFKKRATPKPQQTLLEELFPDEAKLPEQAKSSPVTNANSQGPPRDRLLREFSWAISHEQDRYTEPQKYTSSTTDQDNYELRKYRDVSVLVLSNASKSLALSDFLRLSPKGIHISKWASGIIKVIPGRSPQTLEALPNYFIIFSSRAAALAYQDTVQRHHHLARINTPSSPSSPIPPPPGYMQDGEDLHALIQAFTLVPPSLENPSCRILRRPYGESINRMIEGEGVIASQTRRRLRRNREKLETQNGDGGGEGQRDAEADGGDMVILTLQGEGADSHMTPHDLRNIIGRDSKARNLPWGLLPHHDGQDIIRLETRAEVEAEVTDREVDGYGNDNEHSNGDEYEHGNDPEDYDENENQSESDLDFHPPTEATDTRPLKRRRGPCRFLLTFKEAQEARRFVRAWHRRALPLPLVGRPSETSEGPGREPEMSPLIRAELLW